MYKILSNIGYRSLQVFFKTILLFRYRWKIKGIEKLNSLHLKDSGGTIFLPNHPTELIDSSILVASLYPRYFLRPLVTDYMYEKPIARQLFGLLKAIPLPNLEDDFSYEQQQNTRNAIRKTIELIKQGENILIYPAGTLKKTGYEEIGGTSIVHTILQEVPHCNIVLVRTKGLWGSSFSCALTGQIPDPLKMIYQGVLTILKNALFFVPKRYITVEMEPANADFPRKGTRAEINKYLENWYNRPDGLTNQNSGDSLISVPYSCLNPAMPKPFVKEKKDEKPDYSNVPENEKRVIISKIAEIAHVDPKEITPETHLSRDLCLDSFEKAELVTYLEREFPNRKCYSLLQFNTVGDLFVDTGKPYPTQPKELY